MSMRYLETLILKALRENEKNSKIRLKDISWALGDTLPERYAHEGDKIVHLTIFEGAQKVVVAYTPNKAK